MKVNTRTPSGRAALTSGFARPARGLQLYIKAHLFVPEAAEVRQINLIELGPCAVTAGQDTTGIWCEQRSQWAEGPRTLPRGRWFCLRWVHELDGNADSSLYIDDELVAQHKGIATSREELVRSVTFGATFTGENQPGTEFFVDDFVVSTEQIGCED